MALLQLFLIVTLSLVSFAEKAYSFDVVENGGANQLVGQVHSSGAVQSDYSFGGPASIAAVCNTFFSIDHATGVITTNGSLDREEVYTETNVDVLDCIVTYTEQSTGDSKFEQVTITILDVNDEIPRFFALSQPEVRSISENVQVPTPVLRLEPVDNDRGENGTFVFDITNGNEGQYFMIDRALGDSLDSTTRILFLVKTLDFEQQNAQRSFNLTIMIHDMGEPPLSFEQLITIDLLNLQDEPPTFPVTSITFVVREDHPVGSQYPFANVTASNSAQVQGDIFYTLSRDSDSYETVNDLIGVNAVTGGIFLKQILDCDDPQSPRISFYIDAFNPSINAGDNVYVDVTCLDVNDESPEIVGCTGCHDENIIDIVEHSSFSFQIHVRDDDENVAFRIIDNDTERIIPSDINISNISIGVINFQGFSFISFTLGPLDRELTPNVSLPLTFLNSAEPFLSVSTTIHINVLDINDNIPKFSQDTYLLRIAEGAPIGKDIFTFEAYDGDEGKNGTITYSIESVDKLKAQDWFYLSAGNGTLSIASGDIDYNLVTGRVRLTVTARDGGNVPLSSSATIEIEISPTITFSPNSYIEYNQLDILNSENYAIYLEIRTKRTEGIIFFQQGENAEDIVSLQIQGGFLHYQHGSNQTTSNDVSVTDNKWYSVLVERPKEGGELRLQVWETLLQVDRVAETLLDASLLRCNNSTSDNLSSSQTNSLYIGGVDLFSLSDDARLMSTEFIGTIRNVLINNTQVDLGCPTNEVNVIQGFHSSNGCDEVQASCENSHTTVCVDYAPEPYCKCLGGFPPQSCQPIQDPVIQGGEDSYAPIRFHGNSKADLELDYSFFSDLELQKRTENPTIATTPSQDSERKKRATSNTTGQTLEITFRPVDVDSSVLLYSRTQTATHILMISEASEEYHAIIYMAINTQTGRDIMHVAHQGSLQNMTVYHVTLTISVAMATLSIESDGQYGSNSRVWGDNDYTTFVQQPSTTLSIGGAQGTHQGLGYFKGCISRVAIDSIEIPLSGLLSLEPEDGGFVTGTDETGRPEVYCDLCDLTTCQTDAECVQNVMGEPSCECRAGTFPVGSLCEVPTVVVTGPILPESQDTSPYIIGGSVGAAILIIIIVLVLVFTRACHKKRDRQKRTYSVSNMNADIPNGHSQSSRPNAYVHVQPKRDDQTTLDTTNCNSRHDRGSSVSTYQEHAEDGDPEVETPRRYSRRKSTISAESGIKTDTEASLRSIPRMDDSGNEKETDYSEGDSVSDDLSSTCFMQTALSPVGVHLIGSSNSITAITSTVSSPHTPLTPKERQVITPLRPASTCLSVSEIEDNKGGREEEDTDGERAFVYNLTVPPLSRNGSARQSGRRDSDSENSRVSSSCSGSKWYKSSTASDTERERERSRANRAYYTQRSEPVRYPLPPDYQSPPSFPERKNETPIAYPNTRRSRVPMHITDSSLSRNTKYQNYQLPYADAPVRDPRLRYDNHRLQQNHILPTGPHNHVDDRGLSSMRPKHASAYQTQRQHSLTSYPSHGPYHTMGHTLPSHSFYQHSRSYSNEDKSKQEPEQKFQDLKSCSTINPIAYWEMQDRMKTAVDQVDPYQILSEPYIQFEDVSTDPSVIESQITQDQEHQSFCSQGGGEGTADALGPMNLSLSQLQDDTDATTVTEPEMGPRITHFPSADCSSQYTPTLVASSSSGSSTPKTPNMFALPHSQYQFDV